MRDRLKDKDSTIDRKAKHSQSLQSEKRKIEGEVGELKELVDLKEKKVSTLNKKVGKREK